MEGKEEIQRKTAHLEKDDKSSLPFQREKQLLSLFTLTITPEIEKIKPLIEKIINQPPHSPPHLISPTNQK